MAAGAGVGRPPATRPPARASTTRPSSNAPPRIARQLKITVIEDAASAAASTVLQPKTLPVFNATAAEGLQAALQALKIGRANFTKPTGFAPIKVTNKTLNWTALPLKVRKRARGEHGLVRSPNPSAHTHPPHPHLTVQTGPRQLDSVWGADRKRGDADQAHQAGRHAARAHQPPTARAARVGEGHGRPLPCTRWSNFFSTRRKHGARCARRRRGRLASLAPARNNNDHRPRGWHPAARARCKR